MAFSIERGQTKARRLAGKTTCKGTLAETRRLKVGTYDREFLAKNLKKSMKSSKRKKDLFPIRASRKFLLLGSSGGIPPS